MSDELFESVHRVIIAGSGPAGLTAAVYAARANLAPILIEGEEQGGQLYTTTDVENYPGFPKGILGPELIDMMREQAERFGTRIIRGQITAADLKRRPFELKMADGKTLKAQTFIISTGASAKWLGLESEQKLRLGGGVTACATCDAAFYKGKSVIVIGGGDTAMEEALFLTKFASRVTIIHRRDQFRASKIMQQRTLDHPKIDVIWNAQVVEVLGVEEKKIRGVIIKDMQSGETREFACEGMFLAIGHQPNTGFLNGQIETDKVGYIRCEHPTSRTNIEGVFACGDVMDPIYRQAVTAAGTGCRAAMDAERYLESHPEPHAE